VSARPPSGGPELRVVEEQLLARWPETRIEPSLDRITRLLELLGDPQRGYRSVHLTGTNGKTSTARLVEALVAAGGARTGRLTSPHLSTIRERIAIRGEPIGVPEFLRAYRAVGLQADRVDAIMDHPLSFFEMTVAMGYEAFAEADVDVAVVEVGMGGHWDATNVIDADVAVILPVDLDHTDYLGPTTVDIATEKAGIIKPGAMAVSARQTDEVAAVLRDRATAMGARLAVLGEDFELVGREVVAGGQVVSVRGLHAKYEDLRLALRGRHQAENVACAIAAAEALRGSALDEADVRAALADVVSPGRLDVRLGSPRVVLDAAHNPHGARALVDGLAEIHPTRRYAVVAAMEDKDVEGLLRELEPAVVEIVCTSNSSPRSLGAAGLADLARGIFGPSRVHLARNVVTALEVAKAQAAPPGSTREALVLVTGSVVTVGDADRVLPSARRPDAAAAGSRRAPDRPMGLPLPG
jgi:dihydrofolate synthase/folylpolyglutamate synthase